MTNRWLAALGLAALAAAVAAVVIGLRVRARYLSAARPNILLLSV